MPLYEFECIYDGRFELLLSMSTPESMMMACPACGKPCYRVVSLPVMRPDALWAGHYLENYGYVTSSSQVAQIRKERHLIEVGDRTDREAMKKRAADAAKARDEKFAKETRAFVEEEFSGKGMIDSFGEITPEANRALSDKPLTDTKDERLKP